ncbi:MAG: hypothetical protein AAGC70_01560 [Pseudomonadota bacterium]
MFADAPMPVRGDCLGFWIGRLTGWLGEGYPPLPDELADPIQVCSDAAVAKAVARCRDAIAAFGGAGSPRVQRDLISEYLAWDACDPPIALSQRDLHEAPQNSTPA